MSGYLGKFCEWHKLSHTILSSSRPLKQVKTVTNGLIVKLIRLRTIHHLPWRSVVDKVIQLHGKKWPCDGPTELTMIKTLSTTYKRYRTLVLKRNASVIRQFENSQFSIPLSQLSYKEKEKLFKACIKIGREQRQMDKHRQESIQAYRQEVLKKREMDLVTKRKKEQEKKEQLCLKISEQGFWNSEEKISAGIRGQSEARWKKSLETQLRFRQHVLNLHSPPQISLSIACLETGANFHLLSYLQI